MFHWLLDFGLHEKILEHANPSLEHVLSFQARSSSSASSDRELLTALELLWKYYEKAGYHEQAANILCTLAERRGRSVVLSERVNYLGRALLSAKNSANSKSTFSGCSELIKDIEDKLEVAQVQMKILTAVSKMHVAKDEKESIMAGLNFELFTLTDLYSNYACEYNLAECKLASLVVAGHNDAAVLEQIWLELIDNLFKECVLSTSNTQASACDSITARFVNIAKEYISKHDQFFPLSPVIHHLEKRSCELKFAINWVLAMFLKLGHDHSVLVDVYVELYLRKEKIWNILGSQYHLLYVLDELVQHFVDELLASGDTASMSTATQTAFLQTASRFASREVLNFSSTATSSSSSSSAKTVVDNLKNNVNLLQRYVTQ